MISGADTAFILVSAALVLLIILGPRSGIIGTLCLGLFATKTVNPNGADGLFAGNAAFLTTQLFAVAIVGAYAFLVSLILLKIIGAISGGLRVSHENEVLGLDQSAHSETAYNM
ncbi:MAG: hypothetical protein MUO63_16185 [Desulfobulbaceae bacterium]|nr:hypothetical protein [Desulfobulbaceae bacterium]